MHYIPLNDWACAVWGLETREYAQAEIEANLHLQAAVNAGALAEVPDDAVAEQAVSSAAAVVEPTSPMNTETNPAEDSG